MTPHSNPHSQAAFSLVPQSESALPVLGHPNNRHLVSAVPNPDNPSQSMRGLDVGFSMASKSRSVSATLGRGYADITVEGASASSIQCSSEIHEITRETVLYDQSAFCSTQFYGMTATAFEEASHPRRAATGSGVGSTFSGSGGVTCDSFQSHTVWHGRQFNMREETRRPSGRVEEILTAAPSEPTARIYTSANGQVKIRYSHLSRLGGGPYGDVLKVVNLDSGKLLAVKRIWRPSLRRRREVEALSGLSHPNIVELYLAQDTNTGDLEIVTELKIGTVQDLVLRGDIFVRNNSNAKPLLHDILKALDYLAYHGFIHGDVKPENILYTPAPIGGYIYHLTNFGLCNAVDNSQNSAGSGLYIAPELQSNSGTQPTSKVDIYSAFVTLAYVMNITSFRDRQLKLAFRNKAVQDAAMDPMLHPLRHMASIDPNRRASASDMLDDVFQGVGGTTPSDCAGNPSQGSLQRQVKEQADLNQQPRGEVDDDMLDIVPYTPGPLALRP